MKNKAAEIKERRMPKICKYISHDEVPARLEPHVLAEVDRIDQILRLKEAARPKRIDYSKLTPNQVKQLTPV